MVSAAKLFLGPNLAGRVACQQNARPGFGGQRRGRLQHVTPPATSVIAAITASINRR